MTNKMRAFRVVAYYPGCNPGTFYPEAEDEKGAELKIMSKGLIIKSIEVLP